MRPALPLATLLLLLLSAMAGCAQKDGAAVDNAGTPGQTGGAAHPTVHRVWNYTTPDPGGAPRSKDYAGSLTPAEVSGANGGVPLGLSPPAFGTCCDFDWIDASDLLVVDQLVSLRITVTWSNGPTDRAGLDAAACVPLNCVAFVRGADESLADGAHADTLTLITSGRQDFLDAGGEVLVGVRYTNAAVSSGLAYTVHVDVAPVGNGLAPLDPFLVPVAANATVTAELVGPYAEAISAGLMLYGPDDRPLRWIALEGRNGDRFNLTLPAGNNVLAALAASGGFVRLSTDRDPGMAMAHRLKVETGQVELASVPDAQEHSGDAERTPPPGSLGDFPFFVYADGAEAQGSFGVGDNPGGAHVELASSSGTVAAVDFTRTAAQHALFGNLCLTCNGNGEWTPANYVDDDGTYQVHWSSKGAAGTVVLFTQTYTR